MLSRHSPQQIDLFIPRGNRLLPFPNITLNSGVSYTHVHTYMYVSMYVCLLPCFFIPSWCFLSKFPSLAPSLSISFGPPSFSLLFSILPPSFPALSPRARWRKGKVKPGMNAGPTPSTYVSQGGPEGRPGRQKTRWWKTASLRPESPPA